MRDRPEEIIAFIQAEAEAAAFNMAAEVAATGHRAMTATYSLGFSLEQEKRGSYTKCNITISKEVESPIVSEASIMRLMDKRSLWNYQNTIAPDGIMILNPSMIDKEPDIPCGKVFHVPFNEIAQQLGNPKTANLAAMDSTAKFPQEIPYEIVPKLAENSFARNPG